MAKPKSKAAAAKAEKEQTERSVEWHGLTLTLPPTVPEVVYLDLALVQAGNDPSASFQMLMTFIGQEKFVTVRNMLKQEEVELSDVSDLIRSIYEEYGTSEGESEASQES